MCKLMLVYKLLQCLCQIMMTIKLIHMYTCFLMPSLEVYVGFPGTCTYTIYWCIYVHAAGFHSYQVSWPCSWFRLFFITSTPAPHRRKAKHSTEVRCLTLVWYTCPFYEQVKARCRYNKTENNLWEQFLGHLMSVHQVKWLHVRYSGVPWDRLVKNRALLVDTFTNTLFHHFPLQN